MRKTVFLLSKCCFAIFLIISSYSADARGRSGEGYHSSTHVRGYYRGGTYVQPHFRSNRDGFHNNNWSVKGNVNPYTGKSGTKPRW